MELAEHCALFGRGRHVELSGRWLGDCLLTSAMCRMDGVPRFRPFASVSEKPRKVRVFPMLHSRAPCAKWERRGTKIPESVRRVPEKVPELFARRSRPSESDHLGRIGGRGFKSCHSDH